MRGAVVWLTGLSGAGKSTLSRLVAAGLAREPSTIEVLDADELRRDLCRDLGYTRADRDTNVHRIAYVARMLARHGVLVFVAAIAPYRSTRDELRSLSETAGHAFIEVYVHAPLHTVEARDPKGLYAAARAGQIQSFTGISDPYEAPERADVEVRTDAQTPEESAAVIISALVGRGLAKPA